MFIQVIQGRVEDASRIRAALEEWVRELAPEAVGWLGTTAGVTSDGRFVALARFESESAAQRNSDRPEQDKWFGETAQLFAGEPTFHNSTLVDDDLVGDPNTAGFVQVIQGRSRDRARVREVMRQDPDEWAAFRPDIIGSVSVDHGEDGYTTAIYFTSEAEAREGERKDPPESVRAAMEEMMSLNIGEPEFFDLDEPWLYSPR
jgi:hypothetical protein